MAQQLTEEQVGSLLDLMESGSLSGEEMAEAKVVLGEYQSSQNNPQENMDDVAMKALGGDPEAAVQLTQAGAEETLKMMQGIGSGIADAGVGLAKFGLLGLDAGLGGSMFTDAQASVRGAIRGIDQWQAERKAAENKWYSENFDEIGPHAMNTFIGQMVPFLFTPAGMTLTRATVIGALEGGIGGGSIAAIDAKEFDETFEEMTFGALFGAGAGFGFNLPAGIRSYTGRQLAKEFDNQLAKNRLALETRIQDLTQDPDFAFSIGQIAAENPWLVGLERGAAGRLTQETQNAQMQTLVDFIEKRSSDMSATQIIDDLSEAITTAGRERNALARGRYGQAVDGILVRHGEDLVMSRPNAQNYLSDLDEFIAELGDPRRINALDSGALRKHRDFVRQKVNPFKVERIVGEDGKISRIVRDTRGIEPDQMFSGRGGNTRAAVYAQRQNDALGGLQAEDVVEITKGHNALLSGEASAFDAAATGSSEHIGRRLMASFSDSIDGSTGAAIEEIRNVRNVFRTEMEQVRTLKNSYLGKIFGDNYQNGGVLDPDLALDQLLHIGKDGLAETRKILETYDPATLDNLRRTVMRRVMQGAREPASADVLHEVNIQMFGEALAGRGRDSNIGRVGLGLFTPGEQVELIQVGKALRTLRNTFTEDVAKDTAGFAQDTAINVVSRSSEFIGRYLTRILSRGSTVEQLMIDPAARKALLSLAENPVDSTIGRVALATLAVTIGNIEGEENQEAREAIEKNNRVFAEQRE